MQTSAGALLHRRGEQGWEVLLIKPGGFAAKWGWSIPKGLIDEGENAEQAARRETFEEAGVQPGPLSPLGEIQYKKSRKKIVAFHGPAPEGARPGGKNLEVAEVRFVSFEEARRLLHLDQRAFVDMLEAALVAGSR